jgi:hypothetical protein
MYMYTSGGGGTAGANFQATADGDLNGDGVLSTFSLIGSVNTSIVLNVAPNITETQPEE